MVAQGECLPQALHREIFIDRSKLDAVQEYIYFSGSPKVPLCRPLTLQFCGRHKKYLNSENQKHSNTEIKRFLGKIFQMEREHFH